MKTKYVGFTSLPGKSIAQTFLRLNDIVSYLEFMKVNVDQEDLNTRFLQSLPPEWYVQVQIWTHSDALDKIFIEELYNELKIYFINIFYFLFIKKIF